MFTGGGIISGKFSLGEKPVIKSPAMAQRIKGGVNFPSGFAGN
ncbi:hypothetical protein ESCAB7627_2649 [Escherichia albertii TW07627]|uniref:Uncharacterized protein n=1 Tax=Escherichia albertii (strain TW07627) TaxID=502347 RepID=A0ABC9NNX6_ESCAT|nr:hypothetical protein ESCAB7627_2649 [Escherichia albertii TW07627]